MNQKRALAPTRNSRCVSADANSHLILPMESGTTSVHNNAAPLELISMPFSGSSGALLFIIYVEHFLPQTVPVSNSVIM